MNYDLIVIGSGPGGYVADKQNQITKNNHPFNCKIKLVYKVPGSCGCFFYELLSNEGATLRTLRTNYTYFFKLFALFSSFLEKISTKSDKALFYP